MAATYSYDPATLASDATARVRRVVGDVGVEGVASASTCRFSDEEIDYAIVEAGDERGAAIELLEQLSTLYAGQATVSAGSQRIQLSDLSAMYAARAERLRTSGDSSAVVDMPTTRIDGYSDDVASDDTDAWPNSYDDCGDET